MSTITEVIENELKDQLAYQKKYAGDLLERYRNALTALELLESQYNFASRHTPILPIESIPGYKHLKKRAYGLPEVRNTDGQLRGDSDNSALQQLSSHISLSRAFE